MVTATLAPNELYKINKDGVLRLLLHEGQTKAWESEARNTYIISGHQAGKTTFGPWWLDREMDRRGPGDYLAVTANYDLFKLKMLPEMLKVFGEIYPGWRYHGSDKTITGDREDGEYRIILRSAKAESGLESATAKAAWLDECGQDDFALSALEAVNRRLSLHQGRILGTTTPYNLGWLKSQVFDRWRAGDERYKVIQFRSTMNPAFPQEEYDYQKTVMQPWKFAMFYDGEFSRPAGLIYGSFKDEHIIEPFAIPADWPAWGGMDFGGVNTAAVKIVQNPESGAMYVVNEYHHGDRTAAEHAKALAGWACGVWYGGAKSEGQWRKEFQAAGMPMNEPAIADVEVGIDRVYGQHSGGRYFVFSSCTKYIDEKGRYSRELNEEGKPTEKIKDKNTFHILDAERYVIPSLGTTWYFA